MSELNVLDARRRLCGAVLVSFSVSFVELVGGLISNSLAVIADAAHDAIDGVGFVLSLAFLYLAHRSSSKKFSFGSKRTEVLGAVASVLLIWMITFGIIYESIVRIQQIISRDPTYRSIEGSLMFGLSLFGLLCNILITVILGHGHSHLLGGHGHSHDQGGGSHGHSHDQEEVDHNEGGSHGHTHSRGSYVHDHHNQEESSARSNNSQGSHGHSHADNVSHGHSHGHGGEAHDHAHIGDGSHSHSGDSHGHSHSQEGESSDHEHEIEVNSYDLSYYKGRLRSENNLKHKTIDYDFIARMINHGHGHGESGEHEEEVVSQEKDTFIASHGHSHEDHYGSSMDHHESAVDINVSSAYAHAIGHVLQDLGVILASILIWIFQTEYLWQLADPICTILFSLFGLIPTMPILETAFRILMQGIPSGADILAIKRTIEDVEEIEDCHELHMWSLSVNDSFFSAHIVVKDDVIDGVSITRKIRSLLLARHGISHASIQVERKGLECIDLVEGDGKCYSYDDKEEEAHETRVLVETSFVTRVLLKMRDWFWSGH